MGPEKLQLGKPSKSPREPLCCYRKALPAICWYRRVLPLSLWFALSLRVWSVKLWQRYILKYVYAFLCMEYTKHCLFKVKNKYPVCDLIGFCLYVKTVVSSVEVSPCIWSPRRLSGPLIRKKLRNTILYCSWETSNLDVIPPWNPLSTRGVGILSVCSEDCQQLLDFCQGQVARYTCVNMSHQQCGEKMGQVPPGIHLLCLIPFPVKHQRPRLQSGRMQQRKVVLHHQHWKPLSVFPSQIKVKHHS